MKKVILNIAVLALSLSAAHASLDPGTPTVPLPHSPGFLFLLPNGDIGMPGWEAPDPGSSESSFTTPLPYTVVAGDLVLLRNDTGGTGRENWREVIRFSNVTSGTPHGVATVYALSDWTGFLLDPSGTENIRFFARTSQNNLTPYSPDGVINYQMPEPDAVPVPEASTWLAGALLALPFGLSMLRVYRRKYAAS